MNRHFVGFLSIFVILMTIAGKSKLETDQDPITQEEEEEMAA